MWMSCQRALAVNIVRNLPEKQLHFRLVFIIIALLARFS